jgi:hypothetical protein
MLIKRLSCEEQGKHYGYQFVYGYLPCVQCYEKLANGADINSLLVNRKCVGPMGLTRADGLNYSDPVSQAQIFLTELDLLMGKTARLAKLPYDNVRTWEQIQFLINPKRLQRKKVSEERVMTYHNIRNIARLLKIQPRSTQTKRNKKSFI